MNLVLQTMISRIRRNGWIPVILLLWPVCSLAQSQRAADLVDANGPGTGVHQSFIPGEASGKMVSPPGNKRMWVYARPESKENGRENPVSPLAPHGWYNTTSFGLYFGDDHGYQIQTVVGYRFGYRYYAGLGAALDQYTLRTLPVFADFRVDLGLKKTTPFVYVDPGLTNPWPRSRELDRVSPKSPDKKIPGWYLNTGIGQRLRMGKNNHSIAFSAGYSLGICRLQYAENDNMDPNNPDHQTTNFWRTYKYTFNRLVLRIGLTL